MIGKTSNNIIELMESLTMNEKRYITLFLKNKAGANNHINNLYHTLLLSGKNLKETELRNRVSAGMSVQVFRATKQRLYSSLLKALHNFHYGATIREEVQNHIIHSKILINKGLLEQAIKLLKDAERKAEKYQFYQELIETKELLLKNENLKTKTTQQWITAKNELLNITEQLTETVEMGAFNFLVAYNRTKILDSTNEDHTILMSEISHYQNLDVSAYSDVAKNEYENALALYYRSINAHHKAYEILQQSIIQLKEKPPWLLFDHYAVYRIIGNYLLTLISLGNEKEFKANIYLMADFLTQKISKTLYRHVNHTKFHLEYTAHITFYENLNFSQEFCSEYENLLLEYISKGENLASRTYIFIQLAMLSFSKKSSLKRYKWLEIYYRYEHICDNKTRGNVKLMEILLLLDEGSWELLESRMNSISYYISSSQIELEAVDLQLIKTIGSYLKSSKKEPLLLHKSISNKWLCFLSYEELSSMIKQSDQLKRVVRVQNIKP